MKRLSIVLRYADTAKFAFNALLGAIEVDPVAAGVPVVLAGGRRSPLEGAILAALETSERVLVGWSFYSPGFGAAAAELARVRAATADPGGRTIHIAGGVHATAEPRATLEAGFDLVALGEGERTIIELVRALVEGRDPRALRGIASLTPRGELLANGRGEAIDLNAWPPFAPGHGRLGPIELTRGCIYACKFCQTPFMNRARFRHRTVENALAWVAYLRHRGFVDYRFITPTSLSYGSDTEEPCLEAVESLLAGARGLIGPRGGGRRLYYGTFPSEIRPEHVTPAALAMLARYVDHRSIIIGGQSGSERILREAGRGHDAGAIERAVAIAGEAGFEPHVDFIFGLPGEDAGDVEATLALAEKLAARGARIHGHTFMPLPGTPWRDAAPGRVSEETRRRLHRLTGTRRIYGEWEKQETIAAELAARRRVERKN